jgi:hypothetical protein
MLIHNQLGFLGKGNRRHLLVSGRVFFLAVCFFLAFLVSSCAVLPPVTGGSSPAGRCLPSFPDKDGWYGGDGAYSIKLDDQRTLWLFGDTFVAGEPDRKNRIGMDVVLGTTVGVSTCSENGFHIDYYLKHDGARYVSFFGSDEWLWPQDPFILKGVLYIPLLVVRPIQDRTKVFPFRIFGHQFARIKDFSAADPRQWKYDYIDLSSSIPREISAFAASSVVYGDYVYFYPLYAHESPEGSVVGNILARIPAAKIEKPAGEIEYLSREGTWVRDLKPDKVKIILADFVSELSVRYHPALGKWVAVYLSTVNRGERLVYQTAERPEGPWSPPKTLLEPIPEVDPQSALYDPNNFCYAGKEHLEFSDDGKIVATYVCNSLEDVNKPDGLIRRNLFLYRPVVKEASLH